MAISDKLKTCLQAARIRYTTAKHPVAYTAQEIAAALHVPGRQLAKSVLVKTDRGPILAVLSAVSLIDIKKLKTLLRAKKLSIAKEADIKERFPDVEIGAMSPFGNLYEVPVAADRGLGESGEMVFNAGSHTDTITMRYDDFVALVKPKVGVFSQLPGGGRPAGAKKKLGATAKRGTRARPKAARRGRAKRATRPRKKAKRR